MENSSLKVPSLNTFGGNSNSLTDDALKYEPVKEDFGLGNKPQNEGIQNSSMKGKPLKISISMPTNAYFNSGIRDLSMTLAQNMSGFSKQWAYRFQSVVDELMNNAIEFGSRPGDEIKLTFVSLQNQFIEVYVEDAGTKPNRMSAKEIMSFVEKHKKMDPTALSTMRGRGLAHIVSQWADELNITDNEKGGITAHAIKHFQKDEEMIIPI